MKKIYVGFSRNHKIVSWLIRKFTRSNVSHTYIRIPVPEYNTSIVFQAQGFNVHYINYGHFLDKGNIVEAEICVDVSDEQFIEAEKFRVYECGKPYSYIQLLGYIYLLLGRYLGLRLKNPFSNGDHGYVCVELVCRCLGISNEENMTPQDLLDFLIKNTR